jgi:hypothetical protein
MRMTDPKHPFNLLLKEYETKGKFRRLITEEEVGYDNIMMDNPNSPRLVIEDE